MPRNTRTSTSRKNRSPSNDGMKMHANETNRETRQGRAKDDNRQPRKSNGRFTGSRRGQ